MMNTFDIIIFGTIIVVIIILVVVNINNTLDNKLSNISVNIPPINIPEPQIVVKVQKSCSSPDYDVYVQKEGGSTESQKVSLSPLTNDKEHFETNSSNPNNVPTVFQTASTMVNPTTQPIQATQPTTQLEGIKLNKKNEFNVSEKSNESNVEFPKESNIVFPKYDESKEIQQSQQTSEKNVTNQNKNICQNKSLDDRRKDAYHYMSENSKEINNHTFPMCQCKCPCPCDNNMPATEYEMTTDLNNSIDEENMLDNYRKRQQYVKSYLEDPVVRGYNVDGYGSVASLKEIGRIQLNKMNEYPKPSGYIFDNSPAFNR